MIARLRAFAAAWRDYPREPGEVIGERYAVESRIGMGSYGLTYRCTDRQTGIQVAVKQAKPSKQEIGKRLLMREKEILEQLDHPCIPACRDFFAEKGSLWLVTDYIEGDTLEQLIFDRGRIFGERETLCFVLDLMERVGHVHQRGWVHLDLRIPNIIVRKGDIHLIDFGLARRIGEAPKALEVPVPGRSGPRLQMPARIASDLNDIGHLMLFMLYSGFTPEPGALERSWTEELKLSPGMRSLLAGLLDTPEVYEESGNFTEEIRRVLQALNGKDPSGLS